MQKYLVAALLPHLKWRHHGIGVLQAYVRENTEPEVRIHIWHPELVREGIRGQGDAHDHRFDLESTVLCGRLVEDVYSRPRGEYLPDHPELYDVWHVENARSAGEQRGFDGACTLAVRELPFLSVTRFHLAGETYRLDRGVFHRTRVEGLAVTICTMREKRGQAGILVPTGTEPVHAFGGEPVSKGRLWGIVHEAVRALEGL